MSFSAIKGTEDGVIIDFYIVTGVKTTKIISGYNTWRKRFEARLSQDPISGKANKEFVGKLAELFGVPLNDISIISGLKSKQKTIKVSGLKKEDIEKIIRSEMS